VENVVFDTRSPVDLDALRESLDHPLGEVLRTIDAFRADDAGIAEVAAALKPIQEKLPPEDVFDPGALDFERRETILSLLQDVEQNLVPQLLENARDE
jgi:hypothetical protein